MSVDVSDLLAGLAYVFFGLAIVFAVFAEIYSYMSEKLIRAAWVCLALYTILMFAAIVGYSLS